MSSFRFQDLPIELQLRVVHYIDTLRELVQFRLVSTSTNALVMEPSFWEEILFSKQLFSKRSRIEMPRRASMGVVTDERGSTDAPLIYRSSNANIIAHQPPWGSEAIVSERGHPSQALLADSLSQPPGGPHLPSWLDVEDSFLAFISRLSTLERTVHGVHVVTIKDWEGDATMTALWSNLVKFDGLTDLSINHSSLVNLKHQANKPWQHLTRLDLKDCIRLCDISGDPELMSRLHELCLEGCVGLLDFSPLVPYGMYDLQYRKVNLSNTKIHDSELIEILKRSPHLQELRLDQCYELTAASLEAIGHGSGKPSIGVVDVANGVQIGAGHNLDDNVPQSVLPCSFCPNLKVLSIKDCYDMSDGDVRALAGCRELEYLNIRGLRRVNEETTGWLHLQGVPLRKALSPLGRWRYWHC